MPWLLNEERAVKAKFADLTVTDDDDAPSGSIPVVVRFRMPETELADLTFPAIIIDGPEISKADDREHRGVIRLPYTPEGAANRTPTVPDGNGGTVVWDVNEGVDVGLSPFLTDVPIPYNFDYSIAVYARKNSHLTQLMAKLAQYDRIPARFGFLNIPENDTVRTLDLIGGPTIERSKDRDDKRLFRASYYVRVVSELDPNEAIQVAQFVENGVEIALSSISDTQFYDQT